jgi:hypothetical protein
MVAATGIKILATVDYVRQRVFNLTQVVSIMFVQNGRYWFGGADCKSSDAKSCEGGARLRLG